jgi:FkbM family methyltransferase
MTSLTTHKPSLGKKVGNRLMLARLNFIKVILAAAKIRIIREHLVYTEDLNVRSTVIDLGANEAAFSREMHLLFSCKCFAIEPNAFLFDRINEDFIAKFNYAVTAVDGPVDFYISSNKEASSIIDHFENRWGVQEKQTVQGISFSSLVNELDLGGKDIEVLKIDIEGAELDLIDSLTARDVQNVKQITIEFHDWLNKDLSDRTVGAIKKLISFGFDAYTTTPNHDWPVEMLFLNRDLVRLKPKTRFFLSIFRKVTFLKY